MKRGVAFSLWAVLLVAPGAGGQTAASPGFRGAFDVATALTLVYGRPPWNEANPPLMNTQESGVDYVEALFDQAYIEAGVEKHIVIATLTPKPRRQHSCHACSPMLGGAIFRRDGDGWRVEAMAREIEKGHAWFDSTHGRLRLVRVGPERFGLLHEIYDGGQGYEHRRASLILGMEGGLASRFVVRYPETGEGAGPGACAVPEQSLNVRVADDENASAGLFDLVVEAKWNKATCQTVQLDDGPGVKSSGETCEQRLRYRFENGEYRLLAAEVDVCTQLPERTSSLRG